MQVFKWLVAGAIGGLVGAAVWALVGYFANYEVGWIAWGIGLLAGLGVRAAAKDHFGLAPGMAALGTAVGAVAVGKYAVICLSVANVFPDIGPDLNDPEMMVAMMADEIVEQREAAGEEIAWPEEPDEDSMQGGYPPEIWQEATEQWAGLSPADQQERKVAYAARMEVFRGEIAGELRNHAFNASFTGWDLLWFGLAAFTAFRVGSGATED